MGENKEYAICGEEKGSINISEEVLASIAASAALEVEGVASLSGSISKEIAELLGGKKNLAKGVKITSENNELTVEIFALVRLGYAVHEVASKVQDAVASAVESMTGFTVKNVNVNICGIAMDR